MMINEQQDNQLQTNGNITVGNVKGSGIAIGHEASVTIYELEPPTRRQERLRALIPDHSSFIAARLEAFVGREIELAAIREHIAALLPTGGYVIITGQAGQGKSSIIARLVADARAAQGNDAIAAHFIRFSPGPDHQVSLLRHLIVLLCLKYNLTTELALSESRPALRDYFDAALREVAQQGQQEIIYIDGLDQIEEDSGGGRDLSFLPEKLPPGIVIVIGTRPDDTLNSLPVLAQRHEYQLPPLSRDDFNQVLVRHGVTLDRAMADRFYTAMHGNALYLDLVAGEIGQVDALDPAQIIAQINANPENIFHLSINRLQRKDKWETVMYPILGLLLAARAPLSKRTLRTLINVNDLCASQGLKRLGGLLQSDNQAYTLFHLKFVDYLRQDIFATDEEQAYHQKLADWCEGGHRGVDAIGQKSQDTFEQERRLYARQHYLAHLASAGCYEKVWHVIDDHTYGQAKVHSAASRLAYAGDLDVARRAVTHALEQMDPDDGKQLTDLLARLWKYSFLRCCLSNQIDHYPQELFVAYIKLGRVEEATHLAELQSHPTSRAQTMMALGRELLVRKNRDQSASCFWRTRQLAATISNKAERHQILARLDELEPGTSATESTESTDEREVFERTFLQDPDPTAKLKFHAEVVKTKALAGAGQWREAVQTAHAIGDTVSRAAAFRMLVHALPSGEPEALASNIAEAALQAATTIPSTTARDEALLKLTPYLAAIKHWADARKAADTIRSAKSRTRALSILVQALAMEGRAKDADETLQAARRSAHASADDTDRARALCALAATLADVGQWATAQRTIDAIPVPEMQHAALHTLACALVRAGQWEAAQRAGESIVDPDMRGAVLNVLAESLAESNPGPHITVIAQNISSAVATLPALPMRAQILQLLASALAVAGHAAAAVDYFTVARQTIDNIPGEKSRAEMLHNLAKALATAGVWEMVCQTVDDIVEGRWRVRALCELARVRVRTGQQVDMALQTARQTIGSVPNTMDRVKLLHVLASTMGMADHWDDACHIINEIANCRLRDVGRQKLVSEAIAQQQWTIAQQIANDIFDMRFRVVALQEIATALIAAGQATAAATVFQSAWQATDSIPEARFRAEALQMLGQILLDVDKEEAVKAFQAARQAIESIADRRQQAEALAMLAQGLANSGQLQVACEVVDAITYTRYRLKALSALTHAFLTSERWEDARQALDLILDEGIRKKTAIMMVRTLAKSGRYEDAHQVADTIADIGVRVEALRAIVQAYQAADRIQEGVVFIQAVWVAATNRKELLLLLELVCPLLTACPEMDIGNSLLESISWADRQQETLEATLAHNLSSTTRCNQICFAATCTQCASVK